MQEETNVAKLTLKGVFELFVRNEEIRPVLNKPFWRNGKVYASDGISLIMIDEKDCDFDYFNEFQDDAPIVEHVIPEPNTSIFLNMPFTEFELFRTEDETKASGENILCDTCDGEGVVEWEFEHWTKDFTCPKCDGDGVQEKVKYLKTGQKTFSLSAKVRLMNAMFSMINFYRLVQVQNFIGEPVKLIFQGEHNTGFLFKIGICTVLMMPTIHHEYDDEKDILTIYPVTLSTI